MILKAVNGSLFPANRERERVSMTPLIGGEGEREGEGEGEEGKNTEGRRGRGRKRKGERRGERGTYSVAGGITDFEVFCTDR